MLVLAQFVGALLALVQLGDIDVHIVLDFGTMWVLRTAAVGLAASQSCSRRVSTKWCTAWARARPAWKT
jgi:hypothetical protein